MLNQEKKVAVDVEPLSRSDWVANQLRRAIVNREFEPGERLLATSLAKKYNVSQTPLREAFARLAGEGWVEYFPQRGVRVSDVAFDEMLEVYEWRERLEPLAIARSTAAKSEESIGEVQQSFDALVKIAERKSKRGNHAHAYDEAHKRFHHALLQDCGSQWMIRMIDNLSEQSARYRQLSVPLRGGTESVRSEHERLYLAVLAGDADEASHASFIHLRNTTLAIAELASNANDAEEAETADVDG
jgi:GntR family carbon starvation induced transcriptional regulator